MEILKPTTRKDVADVIRWASSERTALELVGGGTKRNLGAAAPGGEAHPVLDLSAVSGVTKYEPEELVVTLLPGTRLTDLEKILQSKGQQLGFEPPDLGPLYGFRAGGATVGGIVACNLSGPRRPRAGAARDHVLGLACVSGRGETFKCGGRVVKNVTGYDLCKVLTGSYGTLAALTEITLKVVPAPEHTGTLILRGLEDGAAISAMTAAMNSTAEISAAAHVPGYSKNAPMTALRLEGPAPSIKHRLKILKSLDAVPSTDEDYYEDEQSVAFWAGIRDVAPFVNEPGHLLWRLSVPPAAGARVTADISARTAARWYYDWAGGLIWLSLADDNEDGGCSIVRDAVARHGGHATLIRGPEALRSRIPVFQPQGPLIGRVTKQIKDAFDPLNILNPGRMTVAS